MGFEKIVRAGQSVDFGYPRRIVKVNDTPPANVVLKVGADGGVKTLSYSYSYALTTYMTKQQKEVTGKQGGSAFTGHFGDGVIGHAIGQQ